METSIVKPTVVERPAKFRGEINSSDFNDTMGELIHDVANLCNSVNYLSNRLERALLTQFNDTSFLRRLVDSLKNQQIYVEKVAGENNFLASRFIDLSDTTGITFPGGQNDNFSAMLSSEFGQATLPVLAIENRFYTTSLKNGRIIPAGDLTIRITGTFDKSDGAGLVDYEKGGIVSEGKPEFAFNGSNQNFWIRKVTFPLDSKTDEVECELVVQVPDGPSSEANLIEVHPFPNGSLDLLELATSSDLGNAFTRVPGFSPQDNINPHRYHFSATTVEQIKIRLRQRNWVEENGQKVFYYGLQELGLKLVDYDKNWTPGSPFGSNHTFIVKMSAPDGFGFANIFRIDPEPNFLLEDSGKRHIHLRISTSADFNGQLWDSDSQLPPQNTSQAIVASSSPVLYAIFELNFVSDSGGSSSPFPIGTTPYVDGLGLSFNLVEI